MYLFLFITCADDIHAAEDQLDGDDDDMREEDFISWVAEASQQPIYVTTSNCRFKGRFLMSRCSEGAFSNNG